MTGTLYDVSGGVLPGVQVTLVDANQVTATAAMREAGLTGTVSLVAAVTKQHAAIDRERPCPCGHTLSEGPVFNSRQAALKRLMRIKDEWRGEEL